MDDGEVEPSDHVSLSNPDICTNFHESLPVEAFIDDILKTKRTCTHTHTCNPPGPDAAHTHTCYHTHTRVIASGEDGHEQSEKQHSGMKSRKPLGNREAVRKYREKKKAHTAYLEEEVRKLSVLNQQLLRKLQGQALLEAEVLRLRTLLLDLRGKIDVELGVFPLQKQCSSLTNFKEGDCSLRLIDAGVGPQCETDVPCLHPHIGTLPLPVVGGNTNTFAWEGNCEPTTMECRASTNGTMEQEAITAEVHMNCQIPNNLDGMASLVPSTTQAG